MISSEMPSVFLQRRLWATRFLSHLNFLSRSSNWDNSPVAFGPFFFEGGLPRPAFSDAGNQGINNHDDPTIFRWPSSHLRTCDISSEKFALG